MTDFTSGARRRNDITMVLLGTKIVHTHSIAMLNEGHALTGRINPILDSFRDEEQGFDGTFEWLFQLGHVWTQWQDARIGTFPVENWRPNLAHATLEESQLTGEDRAYWEIEYALRGYVQGLDGVSIQDYDDGSWGYHIDSGDLTMRRIEINEEIQDRIVHATKVLTRLLHQREED